MIRINSQKRMIDFINYLLIIIFIILAGCPLVNVFSNISLVDLDNILENESFNTVVFRTIFSSSISTIISLLISCIFAFCTTRSQMPFKNLFRLFVILPMLIPSISIGMGVVLLLGNNGLITNLLDLPQANIYGLSGIILGSVLYSVPVSFLMIENILKYEDCSQYEAAKVLGIPKYRQFIDITLNYLKKPLIVISFSIFTLTFTDYGIPLMVGGQYKTISVLMYQDVIGKLDFNRGCLYGCVLLVPAIVAFIVDIKNQNQRITDSTTKSVVVCKNKIRDYIAILLSTCLAIFCASPIVAFLILSFVRQYPSDMSLTIEHFINAFKMNGDGYLLNSITISAMVALIGVSFCIFTAYCTSRNNNTTSKLLHLVSMATGAIPGIVLGLAYVLFFNESLIYGTVAVLIMVNVIHFIASPYLMIYNTFSKMNTNLEAVAETLGIGRIRLLKDVFIPKCVNTINEMFSYFFIHSMITISAVSFLANTRNKPISLMINQFEAQSQLEAAAVVALLILLVNLFVKCFVERTLDK